MESLVFGLFCLYFARARCKRNDLILEPRTQFLAHRGLTCKHLENTEAAIVSALEHGADGVEFDVQLSRDLVPVVFHDRSLMRLTKVRKKVDQVTLRELQKLRQNTAAYDEAYAIATLEHILAILPAQKIINIELKRGPLMKKTENIKRILNVIEPHSSRLNIIISSFETAILAKVAEQKPELALGLLLDKKFNALALAKAARLASKLSYLHPHISLLSDFYAPLLKKLEVPLIIWGHQKLGSESAVVKMNHCALISDLTLALLGAYRRR